MSNVWDRIEIVATGIGVKGGTRRQWRARKYVPAKWHYKLSNEAPRFGKKISLKELNSLHQGSPQ